MKLNWKMIAIFGGLVLLVVGMVLFFKYNVYYVTFAVDGVSYQEQSVRKHTKIGDIPKPEKDGYVFIGWYDEEGNALDNTTVIDQNIVYYARWGTIVTEDEENQKNP